MIGGAGQLPSSIRRSGRTPCGPAGPAVRPGVVGAALDEHVARQHPGLVLVEQRPDLAFQADRVVERGRLVEPEMLLEALRAGTPSRVVVASADVVGTSAPMSTPSYALSGGKSAMRSSMPPAGGAIGGHQTGGRGVLVAASSSAGTPIGDPHHAGDEFAGSPGGDTTVGAGPVADDDRAAARVVAGDDPAPGGAAARVRRRTLLRRRARDRP